MQVSCANRMFRGALLSSRGCPVEIILYDPPDPNRLRFLTLPRPAQRKTKSGPLVELAKQDAYSATFPKDTRDDILRLLALVCPM
jgi:hypothetical protein